MNKGLYLGAIVVITLGLASTSVVSFSTQFASAARPFRRAPPAISGDNVYVAWWSNKTGNDEVLFRASTDKGQTFGDKINLSNTTNTESTRAEIDADADDVVVTWWEANETSEEPVMKVSTDNGETFGELLKLSANGTIGEE